MIEYTLEYIMKFHREKKFIADEVPTIFDGAIKRWRYSVPLDEGEQWYLQVYFKDNGVWVKDTGEFDYYTLSHESADSHYYFKLSKEEAEKLFGDKNAYLDGLMKDYLKNHTGDELIELLRPYIYNSISFY